MATARGRRTRRSTSSPSGRPCTWTTPASCRRPRSTTTERRRSCTAAADRGFGMQVGVPKEIKDHEYRVSLVPAGVRALVQAGHTVLVEDGAGIGSGIDNAAYQAAGAVIVTDAPAVFRRADLILKVKEPQEQEMPMLRRGQILFTYLHLAPQPRLTRGLLDSGITAIAYETITDDGGGLPLLTPMSEVAGRMSIQVGAFYLQKTLGGRGILPGGVPGVPPGDVVILCGGTVGINAAMMALGLGARVSIVDRSLSVCATWTRSFTGRSSP